MGEEVTILTKKPIGERVASLEVEVKNLGRDIRKLEDNHTKRFDSLEGSINDMNKCVTNMNPKWGKREWSLVTVAIIEGIVAIAIALMQVYG